MVIRQDVSFYVDTLKNKTTNKKKVEESLKKVKEEIKIELPSIKMAVRPTVQSEGSSSVDFVLEVSGTTKDIKKFKDKIEQTSASDASITGPF